VLAVFAVVVLDACLVGLLHGGLQRRVLGSFLCVSLGGFAFTLAAAFVPGVEELIQPRQHLLDRGQLTGRSSLAARALRPHWALRSGCAPRTGFTGLARQPGLALRSGLSGRAGLALRPRLAARAVRPALARMALRTRPSWLALPPTRPLPSLIVCHATSPCAEASYLAAFDDGSNSAGGWRGA
jgi:hypothetical protein